MLDVIFLSYQEPYADDNFKLLLTYAPHAKRVSGVKGLLLAHQAAARKSMTNNFYIVDADAQIVETFNFDYTPTPTELIYGRIPSNECVFCWNSINPINNLIYGYGGVKLYRKDLLLSISEWKVDLATSMGAEFVSKNEISNVTAFNTDPFSTWRSAFRECTKLASGIISDDSITLERLDAWCQLNNNVPYGFYSYGGALAGKEYGLKNKNNLPALKLINDFDWINNEFNRITTEYNVSSNIS
jgi:hypothetical protein